jgi:ribosomal protein S18 acetylase RimI-like enzyme
MDGVRLTSDEELASIGVSPNHQRKGLGKVLVQWGLDEAAKDGKHVWLIATPHGKLLYDSMGFESYSSHPMCGQVHTAMAKKRDGIAIAP